MSKLSRTQFLKRLTALLAGAPFVLSACQPSPKKSESLAPNKFGSDGPFKWRMVTTWPPNFPILGEGCLLFAKWVREMSDGELTIQVYGSGELVPALEVFDVVSNGTAEMGSGVAYYWAGKIPATQFFGSVPFGMNPQQMTSWLLAGGGLELWEEIYAPFGIIPLPGGNTGIQMGGWFNKEIQSVEDLVGLKMRMPGLGGKVLDRAGSTVVLSAGSEIYTNLERGVIDATEWIGPFHDYSMGFHHIAKYYYSPGWHEPGSMMELLLNQEAFNALPQRLQQIVKTAAMRLHLWVLSECDARNSITLTKILAEGKVQMRQFPEEVLQHLKVLTREVLEDLIQSDPLSQKIHNAYFAYMKQVRPWFELSEKDYYNHTL